MEPITRIKNQHFTSTVDEKHSNHVNQVTVGHWQRRDFSSWTY